MSYIVYLAIASAAVGMVVVFVVVLIAQRLGVDTTRNLWVLAIPVILSLSVNIILIEVYGKYRAGRSKPLRITTPRNGSTILTRNVTVGIQVTAFRIVNKLGKANESGEGHLHFAMDAETTDDADHSSRLIDVPDTVVTWEDVPPGSHTFSAQLVNNDHTPLVPPVIASVAVRVK